jgi:branched-chain amino acid transport system permease protein
MAYLLQQLANAVPLAALYAALAFGYCIAFGVTRRADITYGAIFAFAGQVLLIFTEVGWNRLWLVLPAALAFAAVAALVYGIGAGLVIGRTIMRPLAHASANAVLVAAIGVLLVLMELARLASASRSLWLPPFLNTPVSLWRDGAFQVTLTVIQMINTALLLAIVLAGHHILQRSRWGRAWRAVTDEPLAAKLCGVDADRVFLISYAAAALVASLCGILATGYYGTMDFGAGLMFGLKIVLIAAAGGHANPWRSAGGAAVVGFAETLWGGYGPLVWRDLVIVSLLVFWLVIGRQERAIP